eukprot:TRINITY_DN24333_c0_g1_i1.p1 TRINITY_DN24333_c0_g1~~TRINITY_DN24333_c0_g1_i1.p1  ORF type:complete len:525 (-),score=43.29 TRINITY_DN24333_c0_g1_i1:43-1617(-)
MLLAPVDIVLLCGWCSFQLQISWHSDFLLQSEPRTGDLYYPLTDRARSAMNVSLCPPSKKELAHTINEAAHPIYAPPLIVQSGQVKVPWGLLRDPSGAWRGLEIPSYTDLVSLAFKFNATSNDMFKYRISFLPMPFGVTAAAHHVMEHGKTRHHENVVLLMPTGGGGFPMEGLIVVADRLDFVFNLRFPCHGRSYSYDIAMIISLSNQHSGKIYEDLYLPFTKVCESETLPTGKIAYAFTVALAVILIVFLKDGRKVTVISAASAVCIIHQCYYLGLPEYWAHVLPGNSCLLVAKHLLVDGDISMSPLVSVCGCFVMICIIFGEFLANHFRGLYSKAHIMIFTSVAFIFAGMACRMPDNVKLGNMVFNLIAVGIIFFAHQHNKEPIAVCYHKVMGILIVSLGISNLSVKKKGTWFYACVYMWIMNGLWLFHMALFFYAGGASHGLHMYVASDSSDPVETICIYLASVVLISAIVLYALTRKATNYTEVPTACETDDQASADDQKPNIFGAISVSPQQFTNISAV